MEKKEVRVKTVSEKKDLLRKLRRGSKTEHFHIVPRKFINYYDKIIIYLKKNKQYNKTTISLKCWQGEIPEVLSKYSDILLKYYWNGKTYKPNELPYGCI